MGRRHAAARPTPNATNSIMRTVLSSSLLATSLLTACVTNKPSPSKDTEPVTSIIYLVNTLAQDMQATLEQFLADERASGNAAAEVRCTEDSLHSLVVTGKPENVDQVVRLVTKLDRAKPR
jgi:type II secretory pathway component GspD/PulD (secretin)